MAGATKKLYRLPKQGQIAGVCAGLAEYFDIDVTLIRIAFVFLAFITGGGFIVAYILMAIVIPTAGTKSSSATTDFAQNVQDLADDLRGKQQQNRLRNFAGFGLIALGVWLFLGQLYPDWISKSWNYIWPIALILLGVFIATRRSK